MTTPPLKPVDQVFGISNEVRTESYVDRGYLDENIQRLLGRSTHIALRGESKCGKSWLRQRNLPDAIVVQCRLGRTVIDLYTDALSQLEVKFVVEGTSTRRFKGYVEATGSIGTKLLAALGFKASAEGEASSGARNKPAGHDVQDLHFIADLIKKSGRRFVIEDFHYLTMGERRFFAFDLKTMWDYGLFIVIIGVWSGSNMLLSLNPDLAGRVEELSIYWSAPDLEKVMEQGGKALGLEFSPSFREKAIRLCYSNVGILQALILGALDVLGVALQREYYCVESLDALEDAAMKYAEQLRPRYQQFAERVTGGIRTRQDSTGIYAHAMAVLLEADDDLLMNGADVHYIYTRAHARQGRIQKGNLKSILAKFEELQIDEDGRGLVLSYNPETEKMSIVDRQLLLYRRYCTVRWPWEELIASLVASQDSSS